MKPKIVINHWEETCEDDSCYEYGTSILVNGKELVREASIMTAVQSVLKELGIEADIKEVCENKCCDTYKK
ncbi:hypothetical protein ACG2QI_09730 [Bacillus sp. GM2]|jgi:hypothetical protein|uniref:Uncharacterized protein n=1 Tax=Bacillus paralicheniformis TaxID=1648923 RepID=A0A6I7TMA6_9BACI|nr:MULTISPECIES: hypothetical protein [Bacillus]ETB69327.1 hypothetical protein A943_21540 [Bacillus sp. CPSM8]KJD53985.1 hypothetical protein UZ38_29725 [Bacillus amyloliquefaciens]KUL07615.1 hypothetical protein LI7559_17660 [Bacillus licheniformis LMG 7559]KUL15236.1 hypothetical protein LI6934_21220 [Bacillus licheniformis LMG 6934]MBC8624622.1 hypothetical protein [Robertmurraya crescens]POO82763.1 hypothetical protein C1T30_05180 [Bacillus sp. MBGLi97]